MTPLSSSSSSSATALAALRDQLKRVGWRSSDRFKNFLQTRRAGIDFHVGRLPTAGTTSATAREREGAQNGVRLELRYRYVTERTNDEGTIDLGGDVSVERIHDAMTTLYLRVHERPEASRTFGAKGRAASRLKGSSSGGQAAPSPAAPDLDDTQTTLDL